MAEALAQTMTQTGAAPLTLDDVFRLHSKDVLRWAARLGGPEVELQDVLQEVFLTVHQELPGWKPRTGKLTTWLFRITQNTVRHRRRRERFRRWLKGSGDDVAGELPSNALSADEALAQRQSQERFYRVLDGMNEKYRTVLVLFELEAMSGEDIGALLGAKPATVWVWVHRARADFLKRMQVLLEKERGP
ncbi:MAG: sigma-70 family RNA polymerase sigma factor [Myxococcaceae bacterium]|nr:sigma-70 family RNA polymerase sigma factor [Myxococcaceae bacterium]